MGQVFDCIVVGGGLVGSAVAYGVCSAGGTVALLDEGDVAYRASRGNFGQLWVQGKGRGKPPYAELTKAAAVAWAGFAARLEAEGGIDVYYRGTGGFWFGFAPKDVEDRAAMMEDIGAASGIPYRMVEPAELRKILPRIGDAVVGASFCPLDGDVNPLYALRALHAAIGRRGGRIVNGAPALAVEPAAEGFVARTATQSISGRRVVLAAGLGNPALGRPLGLDIPVSPLRGQILVTERVEPFLPVCTNKLRQTPEGTVMFGSTEEEAGFDDGTTHAAMVKLARRGIETFPMLAQARLVRHWAALRIMTPDGLPIYQESLSHPGAFVVTCHSGVTLVPVHARVVGPWVLGRQDIPALLDHPVFSASRFDGKRGPL